MTAVSEDTTADIKRRIAELEERLATALTERDAAIERQTASALVGFRLQSELRASVDRQHASAEILRAISESSGDAEQSLTQIAETTARLFGAPSVTIRIAEGDEWTKTIRVGASSQRSGAQAGSQSAARGANLPATVYQENRQIHIPDLDHLDPSMADWPLAATRAAGARTVSGTPLRREGKAIGALIVYRDRLAPFTLEELELQQSFADQAVIAIENARLFNETKEALERQTATSDILRVINNAGGNLDPVFESVLEKAHHLCGAPCGSLQLYDNGRVVPVAIRGMTEAFGEYLRAGYPITEGVRGVLYADRPVQILDLAEFLRSRSEEPSLRAAVELGGIGTMLTVPLARDGTVFGRIVAGRREIRAFTDKHITLLQGFADQAVIAIENARLFNTTREALERQTATSDILRVIAGSPSNVAPVFEAILARALQLCEAAFGFLTTFDGERFEFAAGRGLPPALGEHFGAGMDQPRPGDAHWRLKDGEDLIHHLDQRDDDAYRAGNPLRRAAVDLGGVRSSLVVALRRGGLLRGAITIYRQEVRPFSASQIELLRHFADQAVIAIENARLFNETKEALERQTATAEILKVIASSPSDVQPVFEAIATRAKALLGGFSSTVYRFIEGQAHLEAFTPTSPEADEILTSNFPLPVSQFTPFEIVQAGEVTQIPDTESLSGEILDIARARGFRSMLFAPLMNQTTAIGLIAVTRASTGAFADHHVQLLKTFADQAVIAIENTRLFNEVQARTRDLEESLQQQTATADVLKVISRSAFDLQNVLDTLTASAARLCNADSAAITRQGADGAYYHASRYNFSPDWGRVSYSVRLGPERGSLVGRVLLARSTVQIEDVLADPEYAYPEQQQAGNYRTLLGVPLIRSGEPIGVLFLCRKTVDPFSDKQIELVKTFADQAVIAIENARLFDEVQARTRELSESLQQQTAVGDVLKTISRSTFDLQPVLDTLVETAAHLCDADMAFIMRRDGEVYRAGAAVGFSGAYVEFMKSHPLRVDRGSITGRAVMERRTVQILDVGADPEYTLRESTSLADQHTALGVPLLRENEPIGVIVIARQRVASFTQKQIDLVTTFADQAVIAIENVRLFDETQARTRELAKSLDDLRTAQDRLIQTEKLASLGQLTAGIAHEIKNPLNFVNNFAALSSELTDELNVALKPAALDETIRAEIDELTGLLKDNLGKVVQHGKRADSIVKNMLLHSREGSGDHRPADINALVEESLNLAYHGARAEKPQFNVTLRRDFDPEAGMIEVFPQEITRVLLNLISNGFYAVAKRKAEDGDAAFEPMVSAATKSHGDRVEIRIRDNGTGIPPEVKEKMFNPFFTTKPAGEGTGLGLSMSHDIVVKQHGGTIDVDTVPGTFSEFRIVLPRTSQFSDKTRGQP